MAKVSVTANGDYILGSDINGQIITVAWGAIGAATVKLYGRMPHTDGTNFDFPVANGQFLLSSIDTQSNALKSMNVQIGAEVLFAKVTGFSVPFDLWVA